MLKKSLIVMREYNGSVNTNKHIYLYPAKSFSIYHVEKVNAIQFLNMTEKGYMVYGKDYWK